MWKSACKARVQKNPIKCTEHILMNNRHKKKYIWEFSHDLKFSDASETKTNPGQNI